MNVTDRKPTVLLAEDEPMLRMALAEVLEEADYRVVEAADGAEGQRMLGSDTQPDLLISDIKMPGATGYELAESALDLKQPPRILLMTGYAQEPLPERLRRAAVEVIYKPFDFEVLVRLADRLLGRPGGASQPPAL